MMLKRVGDFAAASFSFVLLKYILCQKRPVSRDDRSLTSGFCNDILLPDL